MTGTPIGNLEDITIRAIRILNEVDLVLSEDTRVSRILLNKYDIKTPIDSYHSHSNDGKIDKIIDILNSGKNIALVTDAGTPGVSDPGNLLVSRVREFGHEVVPVPGVSALTTLISIAGTHTKEFTFLGFLPTKKGRNKTFKYIEESKLPTIFFESPHRIIKALESLKELLGERKVVVGRELTKMFEEIKVGTIAEILAYFKENEDKIKGEFSVLVEGAN